MRYPKFHRSSTVHRHIFLHLQMCGIPHFGTNMDKSMFDPEKNISPKHVRIPLSLSRQSSAPAPCMEMKVVTRELTQALWISGSSTGNIRQLTFFFGEIGRILKVKKSFVDRFPNPQGSNLARVRPSMFPFYFQWSLAIVSLWSCQWRMIDSLWHSRQKGALWMSQMYAWK